MSDEAKGGDVTLTSGLTLVEPLDISRVVEKLQEGWDVYPYDSDSILAAGKGVNGGTDGSIVFVTGGTEVLRIDPQGNLIKDGKTLDNDKEVFIVLRAFLGYVTAQYNRR